MGRFEEINKVLRAIDSKNPGYVDTLNDNDVNEIPEIKELLNGWKIVNFFVIHDKDTIGLFGSPKKENIGGNRLVGFDYDLIPDI
jgi:hypothetical protein